MIYSEKQKLEIVTGTMLGDGNLQTFTNPPQSY